MLLPKRNDKRKYLITRSIQCFLTVLNTPVATYSKFTGCLIPMGRQASVGGYRAMRPSCRLRYLGKSYRGASIGEPASQPPSMAVSVPVI